MNKNDYVIFESENRFHLMRVNVLTKDGVVQGRLEKDPHIKPQAVECTEDQVVLNLGPSPKPGTVYGKDLSCLYKKSVEIPRFGEMNLFCSVSKETAQTFKSEADWMGKRLKTLGLGFLLDCGIIWELVSKQTAGKWAGYYKPGKTDKEGNQVQPPRIAITLDEATLKTSSIDKYAYVLAHELGHALHFQFVKGIEGLDAKWLDLYTATVSPVKVPQSDVLAMREHLIKSGETLSSFKSSLEEEKLEAFKVILSEIRRTSRLSVRELDTLTQSDNAEEHLKRVWPSSSVYLSKLSPLLTQYSLKNYHELFAETFAFYVMDRKMPATLTKAMEKTLSLVKGQTS